MRKKNSTKTAAIFYVITKKDMVNNTSHFVKKTLIEWNQCNLKPVYGDLLSGGAEK